jgi:hypothetical protein
MGTHSITAVGASSSKTLDNIGEGVSSDESADWKYQRYFGGRREELTLSYRSSDTVQLTTSGSRSNRLAGQ